MIKICKKCGREYGKKDYELNNQYGKQAFMRTDICYVGICDDCIKSNRSDVPSISYSSKKYHK